MSAIENSFSVLTHHFIAVLPLRQICKNFSFSCFCLLKIKAHPPGMNFF